MEVNTQKVGVQYCNSIKLQGLISCMTLLLLLFFAMHTQAQSFSQSNLNLNGNVINSGTSLMYGPDGRLYVLSRNGNVDIFTIQKNGDNDYIVTNGEELTQVATIPNHNDDGSNAGGGRQATGLTVAGTATNPIVYVTSSDARIGGPSGDQGLDTNSGVITRFSWNGSSWSVVDIVRGLPRSEENHSTNGLEFVTVNGNDYLIVASGGFTNAGAPSDNFAWITEYALSAAILSVDLTAIEALQIQTDPSSGRSFSYDIPTLDDPTRPNVNGVIDPDDTDYDGIDVGDPWGGNDGLNQGMIVIGGPVQIFSPGYRNSYDLAIGPDGKVYATDNGANGGWGGLPLNEGNPATVSNDYPDGEPGSSSPTENEQVNNADHLTKITDNISSYSFGSFYGGHPNPVRANPAGAGLFTNPGTNGPNTLSGDVFRTQVYDPDGSTLGSTTNPDIGLPANWPPVPLSLADPQEADWRGPGINNPDGPNDVLITTWGTNTNALDVYTSSAFDGAMQGDLIAGKNGGVLRRVDYDPTDDSYTLINTFASNLGGNALGVTCNSDSDPFPGTIWVAPFDGNIIVLEPDGFVLECFNSTDGEFVGTADYDSDGYTNNDEIDNKNDLQTEEEVICNGGAQPNDFDKAAGGTLVSDLNDPDDDNDGIDDVNDPFQLGDPLDSGSDAFDLPVLNELDSDNPVLKGYLGLGFTGLMNNGDPNDDWLNWLDRRDDPSDPNPNDLLGGAIGAMTMQMTAGTALGSSNNQEKAFQYGVNVDQSTGGFAIEGALLSFDDPLQLYGTSAPTTGELGIYMGDGTQSNYIKFVINQSGLQVRQEVGDVAQTPIDVPISTGNRPNSGVQFRFSVNPTNGEVRADYRFDNVGSFQTAGIINAAGSILSAIQSASEPLAVGLIGSSNQAGAEVEGTWNYLYVQTSQPTVEQVLPDVAALINDPNVFFELDEFFTDDGGDENFTFSVAGNTNPTAIDASISNNTLTIVIPSSAATADITIRATDANGFFVEQTFTVNVNDEPVPIIRIRANGAAIAATDAPNPNWITTGGGGAQSGTFNGINWSVNTGNLATQNIVGRDASVPDYVPQELFATERWDPANAAPAMEWTFELPNGNYLIRWYAGNGFEGTSAPGTRVYDILVEGNIVENDLDLSATYGHQVGGMLEFPVTLVDGILNISVAAVTENPTMNGIEILQVGGDFTPPVVVEAIPSQNNEVGDLINLSVLASGGVNGEPYQYSATNLPPGLQIEPTTGLVFGNIDIGAEANSPYSVSISVGQASNNDTEIGFIWNVGSQDLWNDQTDDENYTARHECSFVQAGDKFYLFGGRENSSSLDVYNYQAKTWSTISNSAPQEFNHFQALEHKGLIWVIGAFKDNGFPNEAPADNVYAYNPVEDVWIQGPEIPAGRKRGSAGLVVYNDKFYVIAGNTIGHNGGFIDWFDEFDPVTGVWTSLPNAPRARDHFHAAVIGDKLYVAGGRLSGGDGGTFAPLISEVDVYDFTTQTWSTVADLPTPRAAASVVPFENELYVIGGEIQVDLQGNTIGDAVKTTEAFNPNTGTWSNKTNLLTERHGTQAIVSGDGIHVTAGSNSLGGGGTMKNMEFYGDDNPTGEVLTASQLVVSASETVPTGGGLNVPVSNTIGNVGIIITDAQLSGANAAAFNIVTDASFLLIGPGETTNIVINHTGVADGEAASLTLTYDDGSTSVVSLVSGERTSDVLFRINSGGALVTATDGPNPDWTEDQATTTANGTANTGAPSTYINLVPPAADITFGVANFTGTNNTSYPDNLFTTERYSNVLNPDNMQWNFPVPNGDYTVNLIFAEVWTGAQTNGIRVFDVEIEGDLVLDDFDQTATYGWNTAGVETFSVTVSDGNLDINFIKGIENPNIKAIEILGGTISTTNSPPVVSNPGIQQSIEGDVVGLQVIATDGDLDECGDITFSATGLPPNLSIDPTTGLITGTMLEGTGTGTAGAFIEENGWVTIEAETDFDDTAGGWDILDESGNVYMVASSDHFGNTNGQAVSYDMVITTPGVYRFYMKSAFSGTSSSDANDTWFKIENTQDVHFFSVQGTGGTATHTLDSTSQFEDILNGINPANKSIYYPAGNSEGRPDHGTENPGLNGYFKVFRSSGTPGTTNWITRTIDNNSFTVYAYFPNPGTFTISMSERSAGHKIDRFVLAHIDDVSTNASNTALDNAPESQQVLGGTPGAADNSPYNVTVSAADACTPSLNSEVEFIWNVSDMPATGDPEALIEITPDGPLGASTYGGSSIQVTNNSTGNVQITGITIDISTGIMPDNVFDPVGSGGDDTASCLTANSGGATVGFVTPADPCVDPFTEPRNGGYDIMGMSFTDFDPTEKFDFTVDIDPNSIKGVPGAGGAGAVSGFELIGATITITFSDGSTVVSSLYEDGSLGGGQAVVAPNALATPSIAAVGIPVSPSCVETANQIIEVSGTVGANVSLLLMDSRLYIQSGEPPFNVLDETYYANEAMAKTLYTGVIGTDGTVQIPVTLLETVGAAGTPNGGLNYIVAVVSNTPYAADQQVSRTSNVLVLKVDPPCAGTTADINISATLQSRTDHSGDYSVKLYDVGSTTAVYDLTATADAAGNMTIDGTVNTIAPGTYQLAVKYPNSLQVVQTVTLAAGANSVSMGILPMGDANDDNFVTLLDFSLLASTFNTDVSETLDGRADFNGDGFVTLLDFSILASNFNTGGQEPSTP
ncbi:MAG: malectin domain-containing carbohydrate-binding protein [Maribacter arcticus]